ncbi:MAG: hypothetical protein KGJ57_04365 [Sphingomonadales bacterium]|nr:hypothetical protein [Sphingomonadales bacterium]MDE2168647.1 hypothetical protein [Sphingomonadales bacterium]
MTAPARITQADMDRATKSVVNAGVQKARIIYDLAAARIEVIIGESEAEPANAEEWSVDDL